MEALRAGAPEPAASWDAFVAAAPGGGHLQSSLWASVKATEGWRALRVTVPADDGPVAGAQLLVRDVRGLGAIAYAPRAPLAAAGAAASVDTLLDELMRTARAHRIAYLKLQPPAGDALEARLAERGFVRSGLEAAPTATVRVDLRRSPDELLAAMRASTRSNVRKAQRKGVRVRVAGEGDLPAFAALLAATGRRQGFAGYRPGYYEEMWRAFAAVGRGRLLLAEHDGQPLAGVLLVGFGDSVTYKIGGWSGERTAVHPNELLHHAGIEWARAEGYRWYDFDGINRTVADALAEGRPAAEVARGPARFKLGFGGELAWFPPAYDHTSRRLLTLPLRVAAPRLDRWTALARRVLGRTG